MEKDVKITIQGLQFQSGEQADNITSEYVGKYFEKKDMKYLTYKEFYEGVEEPVNVMVKIGFNEVDVVKRGPLSVDMKLKAGEKKLTDYQTPYGIMKLGFKTDNITIHQNDRGMIVDVSYVLDVNYQYLADCKLKINVSYN